MNKKTGKLIRRLSLASKDAEGFISEGTIKSIWSSLPHKLRGKVRKVWERELKALTSRAETANV